MLCVPQNTLLEYRDFFPPAEQLKHWNSFPDSPQLNMSSGGKNEVYGVGTRDLGNSMSRFWNMVVNPDNISNRDNTCFIGGKIK